MWSKNKVEWRDFHILPNIKNVILLPRTQLNFTQLEPESPRQHQRAQIKITMRLSACFPCIIQQPALFWLEYFPSSVDDHRGLINPVTHRFNRCISRTDSESIDPLKSVALSESPPISSQMRGKFRLETKELAPAPRKAGKFGAENACEGENTTMRNLRVFFFAQLIEKSREVTTQSYSGADLVLVVVVATVH